MGRYKVIEFLQLCRDLWRDTCYTSAAILDESAEKTPREVPCPWPISAICTFPRASAHSGPDGRSDAVLDLLVQDHHWRMVHLGNALARTRDAMGFQLGGNRCRSACARNLGRVGSILSTKHHHIQTRHALESI